MSAQLANVLSIPCIPNGSIEYGDQNHRKPYKNVPRYHTSPIFFQSKTRACEIFSFTLRASPGSLLPLPFLENKPTVQAFRRFHDESISLLKGRLFNMSKMAYHLSLGGSECL